MKVAVVGAGISGLAAAYRLRAAGCDVTVLEETGRAGGKIRSDREQGWLVEHGPNGFLDGRVGLVRLARDLGLGDRIVRASPDARRRYLYLDGKLRAVPSSPASLFRSDVLSLKARLRLFAEPLIGRTTVEGEESVYEFAARRLGPEIAERLVDPMVTGVYAGDARMTSMTAAFPQLARLEADYGSLVRGMIASLVTSRNASEGKKGGRIGKLASFPEGMGELVTALTARLGDSLQIGRRAVALRREPGGWIVEASGGDPLLANAVVLAAPAPATARLVAPLAPGAVEPLEAIPYAAAVVAVMGFPRRALPRDLDGFGFLVPSRERRRVLGVVWCSAAFPTRAPEGQVLMRAILGGVRHPELVTMGDYDLTRLVRDELAATMGPMPEPSFVRLVRWPGAIPQYTLGHASRVRAIREALAPLPGLHLAGAAFFGVSVPDCVDRAEALPAEVLAEQAA